MTKSLMLLDFPASTRAPGRGCYERRQSSFRRFWAQRTRLLRAAAIAHLEGEPSVTRVTALSGVGRNTFYECFDDFGHALDTVRREEIRRVQRGLIDRGVERGGVAHVCRVWLELIAREPMNALVALEPPRGQVSSDLVGVFRGAIAQALRSSGERAEAALMHGAACAEASARALALEMLSSRRPASASALASGSVVPSLPPEPALALARSVQRLVGAYSGRLS